MQKIGRYQIENELGRGAMGIVYRAFDPAIGRRIAIKTIHLDELGDEQSRAVLRNNLLREAQSAGILSHPNIVTIYDISEDSGDAYIFMEYVDGATLDSFARGMPTADLLAILDQAAEALDYAHVHGIVHRDIKPGNLMLSGRQVKITDFGIARLLHRDTSQSGTLLGTPGYMSPEQISGGEITGAADQYALGVIAYEFLSGAKPFENDNLANLFFRITQHPVPPVSKLNAATNQVLARVLAKSAVHRYPDCRAFAAALTQAIGIAVSKHTHTPVREATGEEATIQLEAAKIPLLAPMPTTPPPILPPLQLPPAPAPSSLKPLVGLLFGAVLLIAVLWFTFGRPRPAPTPAPIKESAQESLKQSPMGNKVEPVPLPSQEETKVSPTETKTQAASTPDRAVTHAVAFSSSPDGAEILVDQGKQDRCPKTPCTLDLPPGNFQISARLEGYSEVTRPIQVPDQSRLIFDFEKATGTLVVRTVPPGASIRIDGRDTGQKTPAMLKLAPGKYKLEVVKDSLAPQSQEVTIRSGAIQTLSINWN